MTSRMLVGLIGTNIQKSLAPALRRSFRIEKTSWTISGDRPIDGSSISISFGSSSSPRATSRSFCWPPDRVEAWALAFSRSMGKRVIISSMRAGSREVSLSATPPSSRLCFTDSSGKRFRPCGT